MREDPQHHKSRSIIEDIAIDMVKDGILDYMHNSCIGIMRKLLSYWVRRDSPNYLISCEDISEISRRLVSLHSSVPCEFTRKPRSLEDLCRFKATELRQFLMYTGPAVLKNVLPEPLYNHFLLFHTAMKLLSAQPECFTYNTYCKNLLVKFVRKSAELYGKQFISYNVHSLIHIPADVLRFGPLDNISCFPFENYLQSLKRRIRRSTQPLAQLVKRLFETHINISSPRPVDGRATVLFKRQHRNGPVFDGNSTQFQIADFKKWRLTLKSANNCIFLHDGSIVRLENFVIRNGEKFSIGRPFLNCGSLFTYPANSQTLLSTYSCSDLGDLIIFSVEHIVCKAFCIPYLNSVNGENHQLFSVSRLIMQDKNAN